MRDRLILGAAIGDCVHVAGVVNFLRLAEEVGFQTVMLGPAVPVADLIAAIGRYDPRVVAVGYRLTPGAARGVLAELKAALAARGELDPATGLGRRVWLFGGTGPTAAAAREAGFFHHVFESADGPREALACLRRLAGGEGEEADRAAGIPPQTLVERILWKAPYPLLRHHYGRPTVAETVAGVVEIARSGVLDVISLGPDQNAQEHFFRPEEMDPAQDGAGGVPVRTREDLEQIYAHSRLGNYPLMRCYSGTRDRLKWAELLVETIRNAWLATPLFWYSQLDNRSRVPLRESIPEAQQVMAWHAERGIPVEMNESHHWSLRDAPDVVAVVAAYLAAYNARAAGVRDYVQQLMFNNPPGTSPAMDLAKMLAKLELVESLAGPDFRVWRETRGGLTSFPADLDVARGHLAATTFLQMQLRPHIVHVVAAVEAHHAATHEDVIENCKIADGAIRLALLGLPDLTRDPVVQERKRQLLEEARVLLAAVRRIAPPGTPDPYTDPETLARAVEMGLLDAPHLRGNPAACGRIVTRMVDGACVAVDPATGRPLPEEERVARILREHGYPPVSDSAPVEVGV
ncbi:MAG: methionine synthase [Bacillota bacterium]